MPYLSTPAISLLGDLRRQSRLLAMFPYEDVLSEAPDVDPALKL